MSTHRFIAGLPVTAESPSRFRIHTPSMDASGLKSWIVYVGPASRGWTIEWEESGHRVLSNIRWHKCYDVAEHLMRLGRGEALG